MKLSVLSASVAVVLVIAASLALYHRPTLGPATVHEGQSTQAKILYYRNPMGLPDTSPVPKKDPMGMDYIPVYEGGTPETSGTVSVDPTRVQRLGVQSTEAAFRKLTRTLRATGFVQADETRQKNISPRFEGWVEKLYANATGQNVKKGDILFTFYAPEISTIESEYLASLTGNDKESRGVLERLRNLALPEEEIERLQTTHEISRHVAYRAPSDATVIEKSAIEGMKFGSGDTLFRLTDLSTIWVIANVFEQDLNDIKVGQKTQITFNAYRNKTFTGKVSFIYPDIAPDTRTAKVRIDLPNTDNLIKTNMVATVSLTSGADNEKLAVPTSALLDTGMHKTVLVDLGQGHFKPTLIQTGSEADGFTEITDGLIEGDKVVTNAAFLIDAESEIRSALQNFSGTVK